MYVRVYTYIYIYTHTHTKYIIRMYEEASTYVFKYDQRMLLQISLREQKACLP